MKHLYAAVAALGILGLSTGAFAGAHSSGPAIELSEGGGSCNFTMKNMFAGPYKVCQTNLDEGGYQVLMDLLERLKGRSTIIMVSHRPSHIRLADQAVVLEQGMVASL